MKILVSGSNGFVGSALVSYLEERDHTIYRLIRDSKVLNTYEISMKNLKPEYLEGIEAVIHLAGENISGRWTENKKREIRRSRVETTKILSDTIAHMNNPPKVFICASAVGYYGSRGNEILTENSPKGSGFLADVCEDWEKATEPTKNRGVRVVNTRFGAILDPSGGVLKQVLLPFKLGLGGRMGDGHQYMSWIAMGDVVRIVETVLQNEEFSGPINVVAPNPVTNEEFTKTLGEVLKRPTLFALPPFFIRLIFGDLADEVMLSSTRVKPEVLENNNFHFYFIELKNALNHMLN